MLTDNGMGLLSVNTKDAGSVILVLAFRELNCGGLKKEKKKKKIHKIRTFSGFEIVKIVLNISVEEKTTILRFSTSWR